MHVAFLMQDTGTMYGAERATVDLVGALQAGTECRASVYLIKESRLNLAASALEEAWRAAGIRTVSFPVHRALSVPLIRQVREACRRDGIDVLHAVGYKADVHGAAATGGGRRIPWVSTVHGWLFRQDRKERFYGWLNIQALKRARQVVVLSRYYEALLQRKGVPNVTRIPSGFPSARLLPLDGEDGGLPPAQPFTVGMMGRLSEEKNHALFLDMVRRCRTASTARFLVAGEGPLRDALERRIREAGLSDRVFLEGYVDSDAFMRRIHVLVMCSRIENLPYTILEAMNHQRPVIATRVGGIPDAVEDGVTGFLVASGDAAALAERVDGLAGDLDKARAFGRAGRIKLEREFGQAQAVDGHVALYRRLSNG